MAVFGGRAITAAVSFAVWLAGLFSSSWGSEDAVNLTSSGSGDLNSTSEDEPLDVLPGLYGVLAAASVIVTFVTTLVCTTMILVHCLNLSPNRKQAYTLREVLPGSDDEEQQKVETIVKQARHTDRDIKQTMSVKRPVLEELVDRSSYSSSPDGGLLLTGTSEHTNV